MAPDTMDDLNQLITGIQLYHRGNIEQATQIAEDILNLDPQNAIACLLAGNCKQAIRQIEEAVEYYRRALEANPVFEDALIQLARTLSLAGQYPESIEIYQKLLDLNPQNIDGLISLGELLHRVGALDQAEHTLRYAIKCNPQQSYPHVLLGRVAKDRNKGVEAAIGHCLDAIKINPHDPQAYNEMGVYLIRAGAPLAACTAFKKILNEIKDPAPLLHSNWVFTQHYLDDISTKELFENQCGWQTRLIPLMKRTKRADFDNTPDIQRKLKVGFISADLFKHSVFNFLNGLFESYDRSLFEFICFSNLHPAREDAASALIKRMVDDWHLIDGLSPFETHKKITELEIDVLIDLSGHTGDNSLPVFLMRAAPVQVTWLGYPDTTGLDSMDYRIVDPVTDPEPWADEIASEQLYRLSKPFICYKPIQENFDVQPEFRPVDEKIVFGSFNEAAKLSPSVIKVWCKILQEIPNSELVIKCRPFGEEKTREYVLNNLKKFGIDEHRVKLMAFIPSNTGHMSTYNVMDVALDPFPYNGTTTSCEALWMGVPFITKDGDRHCARVGMSLLKAVGLDDWIAYSDDEYVAKAVEIAKNREKLFEVKSTLRERMLNSPLCDHVTFATKFGNALREMWIEWCDLKTAN